MRRLTSLAIALAAAMSLASSASAASLYFDIVSTTAINNNTTTNNSQCPAPCFQVRMFTDDPTGLLTLQAIQFDLKITGPSVAVNLVVPGSPNPQPTSNSSGPNVTLSGFDGDGNPLTTVLPFELSATVGQSPKAGFTMLLAHASASEWTIQGLKDAFAGAGSCISGAVNCTNFTDSLNANRIYIGRFNVSGVTTGSNFIIDGLTGNGALIGDLTRLNTTGCDGGGLTANGTGFTCRFSGATTPEPAAALLLGVALAGLSLVRRRS